MFLYTSLGLLPYAVPVIQYVCKCWVFWLSSGILILSDCSSFSYYLYRIPLSQISKGLFSTGMYICRTTNILNCNKLYTVHGTFTSFSYTSTTLRTRFWLFYKLCLPGKWLLLRYWIDKSYLVWIDFILSYRLLFVNTFLEYFSNKFIIVYFV